MDKLRQGRRRASLVQVVLAVAVLLGSAAVLLFANAARETAKDSQQVARDATGELEKLRALLVERCKRSTGLATAVDDFARDLYDTNTGVKIPPGTDPDTVARFRRQLVIVKKLETAAHAVGSPQGCSAYEAPGAAAK